LNRGETCVRATPPSSTRGDDESPPPTALPREMDWSPLPEPDGGVPVNLLHMELLHHFERLTIPTLIFQEIWPTMYVSPPFWPSNNSQDDPLPTALPWKGEYNDQLTSPDRLQLAFRVCLRRPFSGYSFDSLPPSTH